MDCQLLWGKRGPGRGIASSKSLRQESRMFTTENIKFRNNDQFVAQRSGALESEYSASSTCCTYY